MKINILLALMNILLLIGCSKAFNKEDPYVVIKPSGPGSNTQNTAIKGICIFIGQAETFTDTDWQALGNSPLTDFVIIPKEASTYGSTEEGYKSQLAPFMVTVINKLLANKSTAKIWIGTPGITSKNTQIASTSLNPIFNFLNYLRDQVGATTWSNNVAGIYMNMEAVYGTVDYSNLTATSCIKLMSDLSAKVHNNLNCKFLWIPYYGYGSDPAEVIKRIGYVTNKSTIFDYVVIQPHYYFDGTVESNIAGVKNCISKQAVSYRDGTVVTSKASKTVIGPEMELDWHVVPTNNYTEYVTRYTQYVSAFDGFKGTWPIIFYWDGNLQNALSGRINPFFNSK
jgi:hypothetical protein